jgi:hypothetical protein
MGGQCHAPASLPVGRTPSTHCTESLVGPRASLDRRGKSLPYQNSPDCPACSESLHWLKYPGPKVKFTLEQASLNWLFNISQEETLCKRKLLSAKVSYNCRCQLPNKVAKSMKQVNSCLWLRQIEPPVPSCASKPSIFVACFSHVETDKKFHLFF